ncbi:MAG: rhodanese-like domain-containing protein [Bacteroidota bacterium]|nr:rhodanese-like domain-containing protein [Bacteroidota bacterium]
MYIEQLYTNCLAEAAYYVESIGATGRREAVIIDPIRETDQYVALASDRGATIKYILETHFHADFVSGHLDLTAATGAPIVYGPGAKADYPFHEAEDGERLQIGTLEIEILHTPGHTPESVCYLLNDEPGKPHSLFSGDTLFVGDVGRPDLLDGKMTKESLASMMYDSLRTKIAPLPDDVILYPAHGPGSACGKNIGKETVSTIGQQKLANYALRAASMAVPREEFIAMLTNDLSAPPRYYFKDAAINKTSYAPLAEVLSRNVQPLTLEAFDQALTQGALILDARAADSFEQGHISGSINIGLNGSYAWWAGTLLDISSPLVIVAPAAQEAEAISRLARIGYENVIGFLDGGFDTWKNAGRAVEGIQSIDPEEFASLYAHGAPVLDVRNATEFGAEHVSGAVHIPLAELEERIVELDPKAEYLVHCARGYRSMVAASILSRYGFNRIRNVHGGYAGIRPFLEGSIVSHQEVPA